VAGRIAVIEDDSPTRDYVVRALEGAGFTVDAVAQGNTPTWSCST